MDWYIAVMLFAFTSSVTPGPNNIMMMSSGVNFGIKQSVPHLLGITVGFPVMVIAIGAGFSVIFSAVPQMHEIIQVIGTLYLLYLAWQVAHSAESDFSTNEKRAFSFIQAALFQWVNPKAWVMASGAIATFTTLQGELMWQVLAISGMFFIVAIPSVGSWLLFGSLLAKYLQKRIYRQYFNYTMALLLVISIIPSFKVIIDKLV